MVLNFTVLVHFGSNDTITYTGLFTITKISKDGRKKKIATGGLGHVPPRLPTMPFLVQYCIVEEVTLPLTHEKYLHSHTLYVSITTKAKYRPTVHINRM